jgi:hypothetical protein
MASYRFVHSNLPTIVSPVQQRLPLTRTAKRISRLTVHFDLIDVATKRLPASDLAPVLFRNPAAHVVPTIPLEPSTRIVRMEPAFGAPFGQRTAGIDGKIVE